MRPGIEYRGGDGSGLWHDSSFAVMHCQFDSTPESEPQPLAADGLVLAADARLDNRLELLQRLEDEGVRLAEDASDARLILAVSRRWGRSGVRLLVGDFAFALWDPSRRRLQLARDTAGMRPLYYARRRDRLYFASSLRALTEVLPPQPLNHALLWRFLNNDFEPWLAATVLAGVDRVPPAHLLEASPGGFSIELYHRFGAHPPPARSETEWVEGFQGVLDEALRARLRSRTPVAMMVSGGLDSSALACSARELGRKRSRAEIRLHTAVYRKTPGADERQFFQSVAEACPSFAVVPVPADELWALRESGDERGFPLDEPEISLLRSHGRTLLESASDGGCRVVITGEGANQLFCHGVYPVAPLMQSLGWGDLWREARHFRRLSRAPWHKLCFYFSEPRLPDRWVRELRRRFGGGPVVMPWLRLPAPQRNGTAAALDERFWRAGSTVTGRWAYRFFRGAFDAARYQALDLLAACAGVEWRAPFLDRRVVEFLLHLPDRLRARGGRDRWLLREAMRGRLPERVRERPDKSYVAELYHRGFRERERAKLEALLADPLLGRLPYVDVGALRHQVCEYWDGKYDDNSYFQRPLALEIWLRSFSGRYLLE